MTPHLQLLKGLVERGEVEAAREIEKYRGALDEIANMKPSEIAAKTMPNLVHGPALLLANCQRIARRALRKGR